jgi:hypothetical protein
MDVTGSYELAIQVHALIKETEQKALANIEWRLADLQQRV